MLLFIFICLLCYRATAASITVSGNVMGVWDADTVFVVDDITVPQGEVLAIVPGVTVIFNYHSSMLVEGVLLAEGLENDEILFTVADTNGFSIDSIPQGGWKGIGFLANHSPDSSIFEYCIFTYGKAVDNSNTYSCGGALRVGRFQKLRIENCFFKNNFASLNGGAVYLNQANVKICNSCFELNTCGPDQEPYGYGGAVCSDSSKCQILRCDFRFNGSTGVGGAIAVRFEDSKISNSYFGYNYSALGGAIGYLHYCLNWFSQCNNLIEHNEALFFGGGVANIEAGPVYVNNTIVYNFSVYGGGFYVKDSIVPNLFNTILWGNTASAFGHQVYLWDYYATANFFFCDVQGGKDGFAGSGGGTGYHGEYQNNLELSPSFIDSLGYDYHLSAISPCIDNGTTDTSGLLLPEFSLDHTPRILNGRIDMGCYETLTSYNAEAAENDIITLSPVPVHDMLEIRMEYLFARLPFEIEIYDVTGKCVDKRILNDYTTTIPTRNFKKGLYFIRLNEDQQNLIKRFIIN